MKTGMIIINHNDGNNEDVDYRFSIYKVLMVTDTLSGEETLSKVFCLPSEKKKDLL